MKPIRQLSVVPTLPENLEPLRELALNLWWTWNNEALSPGLFSFRLFVRFIRKVAIRRSLLQGKVLNKKSKYSEN